MIESLGLMNFLIFTQYINTNKKNIIKENNINKINNLIIEETLHYLSIEMIFEQKKTILIERIFVRLKIRAIRTKSYHQSPFKINYYFINNKRCKW